MRNSLLVLLIIGIAFLSVTGCERAMRQPIMAHGPSDEKPDKHEKPEVTIDDPEAFTIAFVQEGIHFYKQNGFEATIAHYNDPASIQGQWYLFLFDENDLSLVNAPNPDIIGRDAKRILSIDGGQPGLEITTTTSEGRWVDYLWPNPATNKIALKRTWAVRHDGYIFGSGYYKPWHPDPAQLPVVSKDDPAAFTRAFVLEAVARYEFHGLDATLAHYNDPASIDGEWYVFINDPNDIAIAHAPRPDLLGSNLKDIQAPDGYPLGIELAMATGTGRWVEYIWVNPETGEDGLKRSWAIRHNGYLFGSGYYQPLE